jgi:hypothetical protein
MSAPGENVVKSVSINVVAEAKRIEEGEDMSVWGVWE